MKPTRSVALVCAGPVSRTTVARLSGLMDHLGWVKAPSYRLASRAVNVLKAGSPVHEYSECAPAKVILINVPAPALPSTIDLLARCEMNWKHKDVVVVDTLWDCSVLKALEARGAKTATMHVIGSPEDKRLLVEGHPETVRTLRKLLKANEIRVHQIDGDSKVGVLSAVEKATTQFVPLIAEMTDRFKSAGLSKSEAKMITALLLEDTMQAYFRLGRRLLRLRKTSSRRT